MDRPELTLSPDVPVAFVDVETTGCAPGRHRIIDIAVIGARDGKVEFEWQTLVNPGAPVPAGTTALTGIDNDMLAEAPSFEQVAAELRARLAGRVFVAHNVRFDYGFIRREFARAGGEWRAPHLCTVRLSRALYPEMPHHNLDAVMQRHDIQVEQRHRAMPDARVLLEFWRKLRAAWPAAELQRALEIAAQQVTLPPALPVDLADDLPDEPGVYRFFGAAESGEDTLLYVAQANNLRDRILDHFRIGTHDARSQKIAARVRRVEWTETAGELGALLLEAREIRESQPAYNRHLNVDERFTWRFDDGDGAPELVELSAGVLRSGNAYGTWRSATDARRALEAQARAHRWCLKLLGLEQAEGSCFGYQVGRCDGACVGRVPAAMHLARVKIELMSQRLRPWPHPGPVMVREGSGERVQYHVIDGWQLLGTVDQDSDVAGIEEFERLRARPPREFDYDCYRILTRLLREPRYRPLPLPHP
ncbi:MAG TPA: exonuclease domain-containing protein [Steroidobacteraceae bacterium]|nr:exonuclease domain-containing protein [Steroidobacteraceae bacterium]